MPFSWGFSLASQVATNISQERAFFDEKVERGHFLLDRVRRQVLEQPRQRFLHGGVGRELMGLQVAKRLVDAVLGVEISGAAAWRT